jgi:hypothetical protein
VRETGSQLLVISEREALNWLLRERRMAFPRRGAASAHALRPGDVLLLYVTRGAFHNPTRDRGRVIGEVTVASQVRDLDEPLVVAGRGFSTACALSVRALCPRGSGVELSPLVDRLDAFPQKHAWSAAMRRTLVPLPPRDTELLRRLLRREAVATAMAVASYLNGQS